MADLFDVAAGIIEKTGPITAMKLQKLLYYAQAWSLVWDEFTIAAVPRGNRKRLTNDELDTITAIVRDYGTWTASSFSALTRREQPWIDAREGLREDERGNRVISHGALANYYGNI